MGKNKKKIKLSVADMSFICGMLHLDGTQMRKYLKKMHKNAPRLRKTLELIEKDDKALLSLMLGYHIAKHVAKAEKLNKKNKKFSDNTHNSSKKRKAAEGDAYRKTTTERDSADNFDWLSNLANLENTPSCDNLTDNSNTTDTTVENNTAPNENTQDMDSDNTESENVNSGPIRNVSTSGAIGAATVTNAYTPVPGAAVAGCCVYYGKLKVNAKAQVIRHGRVVHEGTITKLKRYKDEVDEVRNGLICGVTIEGYTDYSKNDTIKCFEADDIDTDKADLQADDKSSVNPYIAPILIDGGRFEIFVTNVDTDNNKLTYLALDECRYVTPAYTSSALNAVDVIDEEELCRLAKKFGIDPKCADSGVDYTSTELPTKEQIETLKSQASLWLNSEVLDDNLRDKPILVDDGTEEGKRKSRTVLMSNGKLTKRQSNWRAVLIPSVTIEF